jgi:hypothetical protein
MKVLQYADIHAHYLKAVADMSLLLTSVCACMQCYCCELQRRTKLLISGAASSMFDANSRRGTISIKHSTQL